MSDVSIRAVARNIFRWAKTVNRKTLLKRFGLRTVLSKNQFGAHERREAVWRRASGLFPIYLFRIWLQMSPDARRFDAFDNTDGPIWEP